MILDDIKTLPEEDLNLVDPGRFENYLRGTGWVRNARLGRGKSVVYERPDNRLEQARIPTLHGLADFALLMGQAVVVVARWEKRSALDLLIDMLQPKPADVLRFQERSPATRHGDIPLEHARDLLAGVRRLLLAAAHSVLRPEPFHVRMGLAEAEQFLQGCRLGQTERGSFTLAITCPLDAGRGPGLFDESQPFTRQVTTLLMLSLESLAQCVSPAARDALLNKTEREPMLSANFCEGLLDLTPTDDDSELDIKVAWDHTMPPLANQQLPNIVRIRPEIVPHIEYLATKLRPPQHQELQFYHGTVETLDGRANADNIREGDVVVRVVDADGEPRRARVELPPALYAVADEAHMRNRVVSVAGILRRSGQRFRIMDPTDFQIIQHDTRPRPTT